MKAAVFKTVASASTAILLALFASTAMAVPVLQIDIDGASYEGVPEESIVTTDDVFDLYALGTAGGNTSEADLLGNTYYLSIAIIPQIGPGPVPFGSFTVDGTAYDINNMVYGTPPLDLYDGDPEAGLGSHSIYDTFYLQLVVDFTAGNTSGTYNVQDNPGEIGNNIGGTGSFFDTFEIDVSGLLDGFDLHFDLYDSVVAKGPRGELGDLDEGIFAPFSHDARTRTGPVPVPEPGTLGLLGLGILAFGLRRRLRVVPAPH